MLPKDLKLAVVVSQPFAENTYIVQLADRQDCLVVDPGMEPEKIAEHLRQQKLTPAAILNTHGHADHIAGNAFMKQHWPECPLVIGAGDASKLTDPIGNLSAGYGLELISPDADAVVREGDTYQAAGFKLDVYEIPGHSSGHVVFVWRGAQPSIVLGGDVLFQGSIGRTDFPDGDFEQLARGIHAKLFTLPDDTIVLPGHGPATTIGNEKRHNPFVGMPAGYKEAT